jgi:uncharacterized protein (DUF1697 family)
MKTWIALLRAINVGGHRKIAMSDLRDLLVELGFGDVKTVLQTGNLIFSDNSLSAAALEGHLETEAEKRLGLGTEFFVRSIQQWNRVIADNPFPAEAEEDPSRLIVQFLKKAPAGGGLAALREAIRGPEIFQNVGRQLYVVYPNGVGRSRLTGKLIERKLDVVGTGRNWNTVLKIGRLTTD